MVEIRLPDDLGSLMGFLRCPICHGSIEADPRLHCANDQCIYWHGFPQSNEQPVLINFEQSIFTRDVYSTGKGTVLPREAKSTSVGRFLRNLTYGSGTAASEIIRRYVEHLLASCAKPRLLVVGGGTVGEGMDQLFAIESVTIVGVDAYASQYTILVCDAHELPFSDQVFDGVVIQAVLEHVLDPPRVVDEIHRVLRPGGLVLADTPFMQQVHEGAYDFTRFTKSGHRWLFRRFDEVESGIVGGPGVALLWSIAYFVRALGAGPRLVAAITALFFWVRLIEKYMDGSRSADAASATYFIGAKGKRVLAANEMPRLYESVRVASEQTGKA